MSIIIACITLCGTCSMTSNSRMYYAFSRVSSEMPSIPPACLAGHSPGAVRSALNPVFS